VRRKSEPALDLAEVEAFAEAAHAGQWRHEGLPYIVHPRAVRDILLHEHPDQSARTPLILAMALLHDVLEDCDVHPDELTARFGSSVSAGVRLLSKGMRAVPKAPKEPAIYKAQILGAPRPIRLVKGADRLDNLRACLTWPNPRIAARYLEETPEYILPALHDDPWLTARIGEVMGELAELG